MHVKEVYCHISSVTLGTFHYRFFEFLKKYIISQTAPSSILKKLLYRLNFQPLIEYGKR